MRELLLALADLSRDLWRWVRCLLARLGRRECPYFRAWMTVLDVQLADDGTSDSSPTATLGTCPHPDEHENVGRLLAYCAELDSTPRSPSALAMAALPWMWASPTHTANAAAVSTADIRRILGVDPRKGAA